MPVTADLTKPYTLMAEAAKMIEGDLMPPGDFMFKAALAADWAGDGVKSRDFLAYFLEKDKGNSPEVRRALVRMCTAGGSPKYYKRYLQIAPHDLDALDIGMRQFVKIVEEIRGADYYELLKLLLDTFPSGEELDAVVRDMYWSVHEVNGCGFPDGKLALKALTECNNWKMIPRMQSFLNRYAQRGLFHHEFFNLYRSKRTMGWPKDMLERLANSPTTPEDTGIEMLRLVLSRYGIDRKASDSYLWNFSRLQKQPTWTNLVADVKSGKFPEKSLSKMWVANDLLQAWVNDYRNQVFKDKPEEAMKRAAEVFQGHEIWEYDDINSMRVFCEWASNIAQQNPAVAKLYPFEGFAKWAFERTCHDFSYEAYCWVLRVYNVVNNIQGGFDRIVKAAGNAGSAQGVASHRLVCAAYATSEGPLWGGKSFLRDTTYDWNKRELIRPEALNDRLFWAMKYLKRFSNAPVPELVWVPDAVGGNWNTYRCAAEGARQSNPSREMTAAEKTYRLEFEKLMDLAASEFFPNGSRRADWPWGQQVPSEVSLYRAVEKDPLDPVVVWRAASTIKSGRGDWPDIVRICSTLMATDRVEIAYLLASCHRDIDKVAELQKIRTEAAGKMPGLYPVNSNDPAYPLYVAADALAQNNPERAWALLSAHAKVFDKDPMRYQPQFVLWALEQYRAIRGPNDALCEKAWKHVETLLQKESAYPAEIAAGLFLVRAEIAEDRLQYEIAHAGYQALRNHAQYRTTKAGRQAMFKDVNLMMTMGAADSAAQTAEQWITVPEDDVRAQGHYVLAKIAFQRKDYDETRKELDKVFEIDFTHAEARLLQGEWKLATNYEVDDPQVLLGDLADRSAIRPGQPLSISVQDRNLAVAGGGASIPVLVSTSAGADSERVLLYPGTRDPSLFRGVIDTVLGVAQPGNATLELCGDDTVSYRIDPEYLKARGLSADRPKRLTIVDDADLEIGSGRPGETLKPGLPLRVRLVDRDRSRKAGVSSVEVEVATSSGDQLPSVKLVETVPCTGVFTGEITTSLPPPRAFASDSMATTGPDDLISTKRNGVWKSLEDGAKPKSVGVDTMNSHLVKFAGIEMAQAETVTRLRLFGTLYGDEMLLGTYPAEKPEFRRGIHVRSAGSGASNRTAFLREIGGKVIAPISAEKWGVLRTNGKGWMRHLVRGTVFIPEDTMLRLGIKPIVPNQKNADNTIRWLTTEFFVDGVRVFGGFSDYDMTAKKRTFPVVIDKGIHDFEIFAGTYCETDSFEICDEKDSGELVSLPSDWTDEKAHPELLQRLSDKCAITCGKTGFSATFAEPERLRTLRWEFTDYVGRFISASKLFVTNAADVSVIPADHDFREARGNQILEVAPGDMVSVTYEDNVTSSGRSRAVERRMGSAFANGEIAFLCEALVPGADGHLVSQMHPAYRIAPGDTVYVCMKDSDLDLTPEADRVKIVVRATSGRQIAVEATERTTEQEDGSRMVRPGDVGVFYAQIRTAPPAAEGVKLPADTIILADGEGLEATYNDADNTKPGVPVVRTAAVAAIPKMGCRLSLASTWTERGPDKSPESEVKLAGIRRRSESIAATEVWRTSAYAAFPNGGTNGAALVTTETGIPVSLYAPALVRHGGSTVTVAIAPRSEIQAAETEGRGVNWQERTLQLTPPKTDARIRKSDGILNISKKKLPDTFYGVIGLYSSASEERDAKAEDENVANGETVSEPIDLKVGDELVVRFLDQAGKTQAEATAKIATTGWLGLADATYEASNASVHLGESFHLMVVDPDRDTTDEQDEITVKASSKKGLNRNLTLRETRTRSGVFTGPVTPSIATEGDAPIFPSGYGDQLTFSYQDDLVGLAGTSGVRTVVGSVRPGCDGAVRAYSKRFTDADQAVLVQFRLAECLFEMAKDFRKLKSSEKSAAAIADGRKILEAALRDYPNTSHLAEGEFLLANLYEQLAEEDRQVRKQREKDGEDVSKEPDKADPLYREAIARFSAILSSWPEGDYAARSQYHKALCLERLGDFARAGEEYVKMTYLFPESPLVGDASVRLASYYYTKEKRYDVAGKIYTSFCNRFPTHPQAPNALFMGGQCLVKRAESLATADAKEVPGKEAMAADAYRDAVVSFVALVDGYKGIENKDLLAQALYWAGDVSFRLKDYPNAYIYLKRTTFEYPESKWARYARGMLLQESSSFEGVGQ